VTSSADPAPPGAGVVHIGGVDVDLRSRVLVAGVVPSPRFGREAEVDAAVGALASLGADIADVSLPRPLAGAAVRSGRLPVAVRASTQDDVDTALALGAQVVLVPPDLAEGAATAVRGAATHGEPLRAASAPGVPSPPVVSVEVDDLAGLDAARAAAEPQGLPLTFDSAAWAGPAATARESAAVAGGCRLLRTADVRRSRRVAEVMGALLAARRHPTGGRDAGPLAEGGAP
jgi:hypothetical protein